MASIGFTKTAPHRIIRGGGVWVGQKLGGWVQSWVGGSCPKYPPPPSYKRSLVPVSPLPTRCSPPARRARCPCRLPRAPRVPPGAVPLALQANTGGAWDNAKKYVEKGCVSITLANGETQVQGKGTDLHKAAVVGMALRLFAFPTRNSCWMCTRGRGGGGGVLQ